LQFARGEAGLTAREELLDLLESDHLFLRGDRRGERGEAEQGACKAGERAHQGPPEGGAPTIRSLGGRAIREGRTLGEGKPGDESFPKRQRRKAGRRGTGTAAVWSPGAATRIVNSRAQER